MRLAADQAMGWDGLLARSASYGPRELRQGPGLSAAATWLWLYLPTEVTVVPLDGEICSNLGSIKGVKEEEDLCFWSVLLAD